MSSCKKSTSGYNIGFGTGIFFIIAGGIIHVISTMKEKEYVNNNQPIPQSTIIWTFVGQVLLLIGIIMLIVAYTEKRTLERIYDYDSQMKVKQQIFTPQPNNIIITPTLI